MRKPCSFDASLHRRLTYVTDSNNQLHSRPAVKVSLTMVRRNPTTDQRTEDHRPRHRGRNTVRLVQLHDEVAEYLTPCLMHSQKIGLGMCQSYWPRPKTYGP